MKKRLYAFILTLCLLLSCFQGFSVTALDTVTEESVVTSAPEESVATGNTYNKLHFYFDTAAHATIDSAAELQTATASVKADYAAAKSMSARSGEAADENVYITVQFASDYLEDETYLELKADRENAKTAQQRDTAKSRLNAYSKSYHEALVAESLPLLSALPYTHVNAIDYSSFVTLTVPASALNPEALAAISENENILHISLTDGFEVVSDVDTNVTVTNTSKTGWEDVLECIGAKSIVQNGTYTGQGVKIGVYEFGVPYAEYGILADVDIEINSRDADKSNYEHTTRVATILAEIVPDAQFYAAAIPIDDDGEIVMEGVAWFIEKGCDIVNCSFGIWSATQTGYRYDIDAIYDYQIYYNDILVVKSAGNTADRPNGYITSPGYAYNVLTVGGVEYLNNVGWNYSNRACYRADGNTIKPNVSAPCRVYIPGMDGSLTYPNPSSGTSFAAPLVTSAIALFYDFFYSNVASYIAREHVMSIIMTSASKTANYESVNYSADDKVGAGIIDVSEMIPLMMSFSSVTSRGVYIETLASQNVTGENGQELKVSLAYIAEIALANDASAGGILLLDCSIQIYNSNGSLVANSQYSDSNIAYLRYPITVEGVYEIRIIARDTVPSYVSMSLSYDLSYST